MRYHTEATLGPELHPGVSPTAPPRPLVKIGTEADSGPPLIIEFPDRFPFEDGERDEYRDATDEEYQRYADYYNALDPNEEV